MESQCIILRQEGNVDPELKAGFLNFSTQMNVSKYNANPTKPNTLGTS